MAFIYFTRESRPAETGPAETGTRALPKILTGVTLPADLSVTFRREHRKKRSGTAAYSRQRNSFGLTGSVA